MRSSARKSGKRSVWSASSTTPSVTSGKSWPFATICVPTSTPGARGCRSAPACARPRPCRPARCRRRAAGSGTRDRRAPPAAPSRSARCRRRGVRPRRSGTPCTSSGSARGGRSGGRRSRPRCWCSTSATSHCGQLQTCPQERQERKFDQPRRLTSTIALRSARRTSPSASRVVGCSGWRASRMSSTSTGGSGRPSTRLREADASERVHALRPRRRAAVTSTAPACCAR